MPVLRSISLRDSNASTICIGKLIPELKSAVDNAVYRYNSNATNPNPGSLNDLLLLSRDIRLTWILLSNPHFSRRDREGKGLQNLEPSTKNAKHIYQLASNIRNVEEHSKVTTELFKLILYAEGELTALLRK